MTPSVFETTDVDAAHHFLNGVYGRLRLSVDGRSCGVRLVQRALGRLDLHHNVFRMRFEVDAPPIGAIAIGRVNAGAATMESGRTSNACVAGDIFIPGLPGERYRASLDNSNAEFILFDPALLAEVADPAPGRATVRLTGHRPVTPEAASFWHRTHDYVLSMAAGAPIAPLVTGDVSRLLAAAALAVFPNDHRADPTIEDRRDARPETLRRALTYIDENAHRPITPADVAAVARITIRSLQLAFRRHLNTTPTAYLREARLAHAHHDLRAADPTTTTVAAVAARWGFASHSRFTATYRATYGQTPSQTLHRH
ncbi:helix-turn-helix transcriptional regulator [Actinoplanes sp. CA-030573]|uniref:helix-turn-helix transcriptional regulator n=1 Tax=Actinoplanes sp. CA-030573 TaxID=3239898 RepID=UPI003D8F8B6B